MTHETDNQIRLRRAKDALSKAQDTENTLRRELGLARETTKRAMEVYEQLFMKEEQEESARRKSDYRHCTL